jgi:hypothetical protein
MRSKTILGTVFTVLGVLLLAAAGVLYWAVVPNKAQLSSAHDTTRDYSGTAKVLINPSALAAGDRQRGVLTNAAVQATQAIKVLNTSGSVAQVSNTQSLTTSGQKVAATQSTYAVDRTSLEATGNHPSDWSVVPAQGLTVSFPIGTKQQNYTGWVSDTHTTTQLKYVRQQGVNGINTYVFQANVPPTAIKDPQILKALPPSITGNLLATIGSALPLPDQLKAQLGQLVTQLGTQPVPLKYTYAQTATYWVQPTTGEVVDVQQEEIRSAGLGLPGGVSPSLPVYDVVTKGTPASVSSATSTASHDANQLSLYGTTLPLIFLIVGAVLLIIGILFLVLGRRRPPASVAPISPISAPQ